ncbi:MAG: peptidylprolyl isomerase [Pseudomonadota bacterium]
MAMLNRILLGLATLTLLAGAAGAQTTQPVESIVAIVEEDVILRSELDRSMARVLGQFRSQGRQLPPRDVLERQVLDQLIMIRLQLQRADATGIRISDQEVDDGIGRIASQAGMNPDQLRRTILNEGMSWSEFRREMRDEIMTQRLRQRIANSRVNITETEVDIFLASQQMDAGEYRLSHILISVPEGASPTQVQAAREKADTVFLELDEGKDFATAAITYSDGQQALEGGDLGWRSFDQLPAVFGNMVSDMEKGDVSRPVRSAAGFHIIRIADHRDRAIKMVEEYNAQHIMIEVSELVTAAEAMDMANDIHGRILDGEDFGELARQFSDDTSSANLGGDMGWFQPDAFGPRVRQVLDALADDELSQPFQSNIGWHILKKVGEREQDRTDDFLRSQARENIRTQKAQEEIELFLRQMRDEAYIEYRV